ncbi:MAG: extracellular solute-binding protein, partial [Candidatus Omnitrophica bacterium]|nr:extracellular solute-binding protein [Candidatus Omnitrophota bacterium]
MRRNPAINLFFISLYLVTALAGCSSAGNVSEKPVITVWHWMTDRGTAFQELSRRYEEKSGVKVNFELYAPSDAYSQKVRAAAQGATLPDIFGILGEKRDFSSFIKAGHILDLTSYMEDDNGRWRDMFFSKALEVNVFSEGNNYGITPGVY